VPNFLKSGSLNLLEPSGPVKACNGIDLPLPLNSGWRASSWRNHRLAGGNSLIFHFAVVLVVILQGNKCFGGAMPSSGYRFSVDETAVSAET
jgi:hypothetical protein